MFVKEHPIDILKTLRKIKLVDMIDQNGNDSWPQVFFIESYHSPIVEEHKVHKNYISGKWKRWLDDGKIWVPVKRIMQIDDTELL